MMKILIANDGSEFGEAAVRFAADLVGRDTAEFKIVSVIEPAAGTELEMVVESTEEIIDAENPAYLEAERVVKASAETLNQLGENVISHEVLAGPAARRIVEAAEEWKADLIVMGTHGRTFWSRALLGSVSDPVAHHANCSVLIVRK